MTARHPHAWAVAALFTATFGLAQVAQPVAAPQVPALDAIPMAFAGWVGRAAPPLDPDVAKVLAADQYVHRYYDAPGTAPIEMDVAYYAQPRVGATAHSPLNCLPGNGWTMSEPQERILRTATGAWTVREVTVARGDARWAMTYWFQGRGRIDHDEFAARWHLFTDALRRRPADTALVRVMAPVDVATVAERDRLAAFATELIPSLGRAFTAR